MPFASPLNVRPASPEPIRETERRDLSDAAGCTAWNVAVWLDPERLVLHLAGRTVVYDLALASTSSPYAGALLSPDGRLLAVAAGGATAIYLLADLVSEPASEPLVRVKAGQAFAWGSLVAEEAGRTVYALYLWPGP